MDTHYDSTWDSDEDDGEAFDRICEEWAERDWRVWLDSNLRFPFEVKRVEDMEDDWHKPNRSPFGVDSVMQALGLERKEDWKWGILIRVQSGKKTGSIPLADVEVTSKEDPNYWPVREYAVWMANH